MIETKSSIFFRVQEETKITPKQNSEIIRETEEMEPPENDRRAMFEFDNEPTINKKDDNMDFVQYPQSPKARSKKKN